MQIKVIFIRMVSHLDSLSNRGTRELGNGPFGTVKCKLAGNDLEVLVKLKAIVSDFH